MRHTLIGYFRYFIIIHYYTSIFKVPGDDYTPSHFDLSV
uniref:Uncharacterized protein n=1 Tax=Enterobacter sp. HP19 TaxID=1811975 RepID=A0A2H4UE95_9ENTR|nr:hypothetical protein [Enterobacter sp. HP19]